MPQIEYVTVANHAEAINGLLYLQGAGWQSLNHPVAANGQHGVFHLGIGLSILIGWNETNRRYPLNIYLRSEDNQEVFKVPAITEAGRPPGAVPGTDFRSVMAMNADIQFPQPGGYVLGAEVDGQTAETGFRVDFP